MYSYYVNQNIYLTIKYLCVIVQSIYLFMIYKAKRSTQTRGGAPGYIPGCIVFFILFSDWRCRTWRKYREQKTQSRYLKTIYRCT